MSGDLEYGRLWFNKIHRGAHVFAYEVRFGPVPDGLLVDHRCRNTLCVNPEHLRLATGGQNNQNRARTSKKAVSGIRGVHKYKKPGVWFVRVIHEGHQHWGGLFTDLAEAEAKAIAMRNELFTHNDADRQSAA